MASIQKRKGPEKFAYDEGYFTDGVNGEGVAYIQVKERGRCQSEKYMQDNVGSRGCR